MNIETKLQICAGAGAIVALPLMYVGLHNGTTALAGAGLALFFLSMLVTPILRLRPTPAADR